MSITNVFRVQSLTSDLLSSLFTLTVFTDVLRSHEVLLVVIIASIFLIFVSVDAGPSSLIKSVNKALKESPG